MKSRIKSLGKEIPKGAEPITMRNYLIIWIILMSGCGTAVFSFLMELNWRKSKFHRNQRTQSAIFLR